MVDFRLLLENCRFVGYFICKVLPLLLRHHHHQGHVSRSAFFFNFDFPKIGARMVSYCQIFHWHIIAQKHWQSKFSIHVLVSVTSRDLQLFGSSSSPPSHQSATSQSEMIISCLEKEVQKEEEEEEIRFADSERNDHGGRRKRSSSSATAEGSCRGLQPEYSWAADAATASLPPLPPPPSPLHHH